MPAPPLLSLRDAAIGFGGRPTFTGVSLAIGAGERVCLVGRNGSGKSTLLKALGGLIELDSGERFVQPGTHVAYMPQVAEFDAASPNSNMSTRPSGTRLSRGASRTPVCCVAIASA
jgi:ATPase subunit of ABC transporter with duplicated ATPase domains